MQNKVIDGEQPKVENGSPFGKFESAEKLKTAYENLEREFTRKSQLLSVFQKDQEELKEEGNNCNDSESKDAGCQKEIMSDDVTTPFWEKIGWDEEVQKFLKDNPLAKSHAKEISKLVLEDKELLSSERPLYAAWAKWLENNYKTPEQLLSDENFLASVQANEKVRRGVIKNYLTEINSRETTPPLFASSDGAGLSDNRKSPKSFDEVRELVKKIFSK